MGDSLDNGFKLKVDDGSGDLGYGCCLECQPLALPRLFYGVLDVGPTLDSFHTNVNIPI